MREELPSILITDGWVTNDNDALVEVVVPSTVETYQGPNKITFLGETLNWIPTATTTLQEFEAPNVTGLIGSIFASHSNLVSAIFPKLKTITVSITGGSGGTFYNCANLINVSMPELESISCTGTYNSNGSPTYVGIFYGCSNLVSVSLPKLTSIFIGGSASKLGVFATSGIQTVSLPELLTITCNGGGLFNYCTGITSINCPKLTSITWQGSYPGDGGPFSHCTSLTTVTLPSIQLIDSANANNKGTFSNDTGLTSVQLGSEGHPVTSIANYTFSGCTQSGLTITIYTTNGASLSGSPWGATNATIVYETA